MTAERGETTGGKEAKHAKAHKFLGSLKDALMAAGRDEAQTPPAIPQATLPQPEAKIEEATVIALPSPQASAKAPSPSAEEAARLARTMPAHRAAPEIVMIPAKDRDEPPTTRVVRPEPKPQAGEPRTVLVRGKQQISRDTFERDPVVGFLVVVGGPGLGAFRPIFEGNNTLGRGSSNRIPLDFGDEAISNDAQAYLRYDSSDRSFLFVPNLAKTNVVSVNEKKPTAAVPLQPMDVITLGRTQVAFLPFCGADFDWSEISEA